MSKEIIVIDRGKLLEEVEDLTSIEHGGVPYIPLQNVKNLILGFCELKNVIEFEGTVTSSYDSPTIAVLCRPTNLYVSSEKFKRGDDVEILVVKKEDK